MDLEFGEERVGPVPETLVLQFELSGNEIYYTS